MILTDDEREAMIARVTKRMKARYPEHGEEFLEFLVREMLVLIEEKM